MSFLPFTLCLLWFSVLQAQPTNNPYRDRYLGIDAPVHWTDSLKWSTIINVTAAPYNAIPDDEVDDLAAVNSAIDFAHNAGGGVVFFPAGTYIISNDIALKSGVILRGQTPAVNNAKDSLFRPASKLVFPRYVPTNSGAGTANSTAFKEIVLHNHQASNVGVIDLDINRGAIHFMPLFDSLPNNNHQVRPGYENRNMLVMGIRSNNVAFPDPAIPNANQNAWNRWGWRFAANIEITASANAIVANCRMNDEVTDNFPLVGYVAQSGQTNSVVSGNRCQSNVWVNLDTARFRIGSTATFAKMDSLMFFDYTKHYGISLNRSKIVEKAGRRTIQPFVWYPMPSQEPLLFAPGNEILDCWVYKTERIGITGAGNGLKINGNIVKDNTNKCAPVNATGTRMVSGCSTSDLSATLENRGIDFSGWNVEINNNDVEVYSPRWCFQQQYTPTDGEGIMNQGNSGGSLVNGVAIIGNIVNSNIDRATNPTIGLYRLQDISNVYIADNKFTGIGGYMQVEANKSDGTLWSINNVLVENNEGIKDLNVRGSVGGNNVVIRNNKGTRKLEVNCYAQLINNTGFTTVPTCFSTIIPNDQFPVVRVTIPSVEDTILKPNDLLTLTYVLENGTPDSVVIWNDDKRLGLATISGTTATFTWTVPTKLDEKYEFYAIAYRTISGTRAQSGSAIRRVSVYSVPQVDAPRFTPNGGSFATSTLIAIEVDTANAQIFYNANPNLTPSLNSTRYQGTFDVTATTTLRARAFKAGFAPSAIVSASFQIMNASPVAPSMLTAQNVTTNSLTLLWRDNSSNEMKFYIKRSADSLSGYVVIDSTNANQTTYNDTGLMPATRYFYRIAAANAAGMTDSDVLGVTTRELAPNPPSALQEVSSTFNSITITWTDNSNNETKFYIERSTDSLTGYVVVDSVMADVNTYTNVNLSSNTTYFYRVRAYNNGGYSAYSSILEAKTQQILGTTDDITPIASVEVYPNPAESVLYIKPTNMAVNVVNIYDLTSTLVLSLQPTDPSGTLMVDIRDLASGIYVLTVASSQKTWHTKLVKP